MTTERKVIDFKIHNLTEEQFQELKETGQIDPNAIYCTPDETVANFEKVNARIDTKQDIATAINYGHVANCITEIPQDIKLELNNGVLTLKAGSKVYIPNGAGAFDELTIQRDLSSKDSTNGTAMFFVTAGGELVLWSMNGNIVSGPTYNGDNFGLWYDTTNNRIRHTTNSGSTWSYNLSLPVGVYTVSDGAISSIDQVFNGFGYIGSTVFALPGVKGLIPNGRNADGSLNNIEVTTSAVQTMTMASYMAGRANAPLALWADKKLGGMEIDQRYWGTVKKLSDIVRPSYYACYYCLEDNLVHYFDGSGVESIRQQAFIGSFNVGSDNKITQFTSKPAFHAVDYNDLPDTIAIAAPAGIVTAFAGTTPPAGWLKCDGSAISRTKYAKLFAAIGGHYGVGDGSTTFNLPNLIGRVPFGMHGQYVGQSTNGVLPNITGTWQDYENHHGWVSPTGAFLATAEAGAGGIGHDYNFYRRTMDFNAQRSNSMYGGGWFDGTRVVPASVGMTYCIKY